MKRGIALEGGGAKGAFQVGAMKAIQELELTYDGVVGASIGAINGALIAMGDMALLEKIWLSVEAKDMIKGDPILLEKIIKLDFSGDITAIREVVIETIKQGGLDVTPYKNYLKTHIDEAAIRKSNIAYGLVTLSLTDLKPIEIFVEDIPEGKLHDYIIASANFPAFKSEKIDNKRLVDGGFFDNCPINMLLEKGYDEVIAIRIMGIGRIRKVKKEHQDKVIYITPSEDLGKTLEIDPVKAKYNMKMGYFDTLKVLSSLKGDQYYLKDNVDEASIFKKLSDLPDDFVGGLMETLNYDGMIPRRFLFEVFMPLLGEVLGLKKTATYGDMLIAYYEALADLAEIDRFKLYTLETFAEEVTRQYRKKDDVLIKELDSLSVSLLSFIKATGISVMPSKQKKLFLKYVMALSLKFGVSFV